MADEVVRKTELNQLPTDRGQHAVPHEGERIPLRIGAEAGFRKNVDGMNAYARAYAEAQDDGKFGRHLGLTIPILAGAAIPGITVAIILAIATAPEWLIIVGGIGVMLVMAGVLYMYKKLHKD
ncbi:hypothetical protein LCL61_08800 [Amycolatopsis coloradensis]|uniref:Uncharacterized protein n=1 Tax=Amycolatopsis coloradensis TaxID=76021 RepID=A0ACD5B8F3_9PSEU